MFLRRSAVALAATAVLCASAAPAALADPTPATGKALPAGLFGTGDPNYDGVWRQSLALLALDATGARPPGEAVRWLADQQCDDGSFVAYRPDTGKPCDPTAQPGDTNATAAAVQALAALEAHGPESAPVREALSWLKSVQNDDGGWPYTPGDDSDANSTAVVIGALSAAGEDPARTEPAGGGRSAYEGLAQFQLGCDAPGDERGAFDHQPEEGRLAADAMASAAAVLGAYGAGWAKAPQDAPEGGAPRCEGDERFAPGTESARAGAAYLERALAEHGGHLMSTLAGAEDQPDYGTTTKAALALGAGGRDAAAQEALDWLARNHARWEGLTQSPAGLGELVLAVRAAGGDPADFGGTDLVAALAATGPAQEGADAGDTGARDDTQADARAEDASEDDGSPALWWIVGACVLAGVGIGMALSLRRRGGTGQRL
ncbi:prenyltransferase/squalene oxidase repeat-containing protein [Streptomyces sp. TRM 70351]|uniref:prenyltransferase/squalene oxidase repeat-containing protein n=1 Tax=Streptomyces sp. TRM 70351 TaxID=3116552 RepID=UPI002E7C061B|nr:prenyltransferase/squalene oxidase repeat-containing protein [Streptomyces sp. TRM 70351]MEE1928556.1 prenyltransferase/squalene oxidase repeat-containing protein [Streptomyces sp. TRM 70351]